MKKKLWITYAWKDNKESDFDFLVNQLSDEIECSYDRVELIPGQRLWEQIGSKIMNSNIDGWAILITENSLKSQPCLEEIEYAVNRAISSEVGFPLIGLLHNVSIKDVPAALKTRLCISMKDPKWKEQIIAGLEKRPPKVEKQNLSNLICTCGTLSEDKSTVFAIRPRFGELINWRFAVLENVEIIEFGDAPTIEKLPFVMNLSKVKFDVIEGTIDLEGKKHIFVGCKNVINPAVSAFLRVKGRTDQIWFGSANGAMEVPELWYPVPYVNH